MGNQIWLQNIRQGMVSPPGDYLREELAERGWTSVEFAGIIGRPPQTVSQILNAKKEITPNTAVAISKALGTSAEMWLGLQTSYSLHRSRLAAEISRLDDIERRARLRSLVPVAECFKRGWITAGPSDIDTAETEVAALLDVDSLDDPPRYALAARRSNTTEPLSPAQIAWLGKVRLTAATMPAEVFDAAKLATTAEHLARTLRRGPQTLPLVPGMLRQLRGAGRVLRRAQGRQTRRSRHVPAGPQGCHRSDHQREPLRHRPVHVAARMCPHRAGATSPPTPRTLCWTTSAPLLLLLPARWRQQPTTMRIAGCCPTDSKHQQRHSPTFGSAVNVSGCTPAS